MSTIKFHVSKITDRQDVEMMTLLLSRQDALQFIREDQLADRVYSDDKSMVQTILKLDTSSQLFSDFMQANEEVLLFEVFPAEVFASLSDNSDVVLNY